MLFLFENRPLFIQVIF